MSSYIPVCVPSIQGKEWEYIKDCIDTEWVSSAGKYVELFEQKIAEYIGSKYAIACINGTSALQVSLRLAGVLHGDEVIVPPYTMSASATCVLFSGGVPIFSDIDDEIFCLDPNVIEKSINKRTKGIHRKIKEET